jgi:hypothetical protein
MEAINKEIVIGNHRGNLRLWMENQTILINAGFPVGKVYFVHYGKGRIVLSLKVLPWDLKRNSPNINNRNVSKKMKKGKESPVIDLCSKKVTISMAGFSTAIVKYEKGKITLKGQ